MMQYPPQPPSNQPYYAPSEIYLPEQPQAHAPLPAVYTPRDQPPSTGQEIAIYYNQTLLTSYARLCKVLLIVLIVLLPLFLIAGFAASSGTFKISDIAPLVFIVVILLAAIFLLVWWIRVIGSLSGPTRKPALHITREGITIQNNVMVRYQVIPWNEIQAIDASKVNLKIRHATPFSSPSDNPEQLRRGTSKTTVISLMYLDTPAQEMLRQLRKAYASELRYYNIQFRS